MMPDIIKPLKTVENISEAELKEKGSLFKGIIYPVNDQQEAVTTLNMLRKKFYDATHHCYAYRLLNDDFKYSDDGEPSGSAGKRILNAIDHYELMDVLCVIIRWFGGTKLGTGLLGKTYYSAADEVIKSSAIITRYPYHHFRVKASYELTRQLHYVFNKNHIIIERRDYSDIPEYSCYFPDAGIEKILQELNKINVELEDSHRLYYFTDNAID
jgi:uncharacterized YigZ family protein